MTSARSFIKTHWLPFEVLPSAVSGEELEKKELPCCSPLVPKWAHFIPVPLCEKGEKIHFEDSWFPYGGPCSPPSEFFVRREKLSVTSI